MIRRAFIGITRRNRNPLDPHFHGEIEKLRRALGGGVIEQGGVDRDPEALFDRLADGVGGDFENPFLVDRPVVFFLQAVEVDGEGQVGGGFEEVHLFL